MEGRTACDSRNAVFREQQKRKDIARVNSLLLVSVHKSGSVMKERGNEEGKRGFIYPELLF
jgi:hypothetical protein